MKKKLLDLEMKYSYVEVNFDILNLNNLSSSLCLVTDYSGIAFDFAFGLKQPVIFIDSGKKINNLNYKNVYQQQQSPFPVPFVKYLCL